MENKGDIALGYVLLYVRDVKGALGFYEEAFGLKRRFLDDTGSYGELETGATRLGFVSRELAKENFPQGIIEASADKAPIAAEIAFTTQDVEGVYDRALKAGAAAVAKPSKKPWGQTVSYVRDREGHLVEICSPMP